MHNSETDKLMSQDRTSDYKGRGWCQHLFLHFHWKYKTIQLQSDLSIHKAELQTITPPATLSN